MLHTDNHTSTQSLNFYKPDALPAAKPTVPWTKGNIWHVQYFRRQINKYNYLQKKLNLFISKQLQSYSEHTGIF